MKLLFICNQNQYRSPTAREIFKNEFETKSAGLFSETPVTKEELEWADLVIVMEDFQRKELEQRFPEEFMKKRVLTLNVRDEYQYMQPELVSLLKEKMQSLVKPLLKLS